MRDSHRLSSWASKLPYIIHGARQVISCLLQGITYGAVLHTRPGGCYENMGAALIISHLVILCLALQRAVSHRPKEIDDFDYGSRCCDSCGCGHIRGKGGCLHDHPRALQFLQAPFASNVSDASSML